jgi:hypothetical protein
MRRRPFVPLFALLIGCALGCGSSAVGTVEGEVLLDGAPLKEGVVRFVPVDGKSQTASALIADGKFTEKVPVGTHRVEISSPKLPAGINSAKEMKRGTVDEGAALEEMIPARYNSNSDLKETIKPGANPVRFDLKSR